MYYGIYRNLISMPKHTRTTDRRLQSCLLKNGATMNRILKVNTKYIHVQIIQTKREVICNLKSFFHLQNILNIQFISKKYEI